MDLHVSGLWSQAERQESINFLELRAIRKGLLQFSDFLLGKAVGPLSDNTTVLSYVKKGGGSRSASLNAEAQLTLQGQKVTALLFSRSSSGGKDNVVADAHSRHGQIYLTVWILHQEVVDRLLRLWSYI